MTQQSIAFVILHYLSARLTQCCVDSILTLGVDLEGLRPAVVIIDNASANGSLEKLEKLYGSREDVAFVRNERNLGFSRANNLGFRAAVALYDPRHVVVLNNDTEIRQADFLDALEETCERTGAHVLGPDVYVERKGFHQSPMDVPFPTEGAVRKRLADLDRGLPLMPRQAVGALLRSCAPGRSLLNRRALLKARRYRGWRRPSLGPTVLHGAALIFTSRFLATGEDPFRPETFLYHEEDILAVRCQRNGWLVAYEPALQVIHHDDGATEVATGGGGAKAEFVRRHNEESYRVFAEYFLGEEP